jgi:phenylalanyl-tRNA synthetase beta chain
MKVPISWLKEFVDIDVSAEELAWRLTLAGLEVEEIHYVGLPLPEGKGGDGGHRRVTKTTGLAWDRDTIVVGAIHEVMPHPNADRLVLCRLHDSQREHTVLTGAPNLFPYKGAGPLATPLKVAYAREGAVLYDGHQAGWELMTLKRTKIRGVVSYSMACSEKELGISEDHEGIILLDEDAPVGTPLADYMGDAVLDINIMPNTARCASILGMAREVSALTGKKLKAPSYEVHWTGPSVEGRVSLEIRKPEMNPRFVLGLIEGIEIKPSPYWVQRRLRLAGMRPISNIVDATNYVMLEVGEPLHAFDYDVLVKRAGGSAPTILTRLAEPGETLTTLDGVERVLDDFTVMVADRAGGLSIAGVMGGAQSEVSDATRRILLEGAAWNFINIRRTIASQKLLSEAAYRFSRGVHPAMAERGVRRGLELMRRLAGGEVARGLVDAYPLPPDDPTVELTPPDVERWLGIRLETKEIADIVARLGFAVEIRGDAVRAKSPDHRLDIGEGIVGKADLVEEIARIHGYDVLPETQISDTIPPQYGNREQEGEDRVRDLLVGLGLQEVITYRLTSPEHDARSLGPGAPLDASPHIRLANPISGDRVVLRHSVLASVLEVAESNARLRERLALFEIGPVFDVMEGQPLPRERQQVVILLRGRRELPTWKPADTSPMDFFDLKGLLEEFLSGLKVNEVQFEGDRHPSFHPGKCARLRKGEDQVLGVMGELHPLVVERYDLGEGAILAAILDLGALMDVSPSGFTLSPVPVFPPVLEDLAIVVDVHLPAQQAAQIIREAGKPLVSEVRLFDIYQGDPVPKGKKSLAYSIVYQAADRTLTDEEVAAMRKAIVARLKDEVGGELRV